MASNGYIGKISALVSASTEDLSRKLRSSTGEVTAFANSLAGQISRQSKVAEQSLQKIFTPIQQLERKLRAAGEARIFRRDDIDRYINSIRQATSLAEGINKPLTGVTNQFTKLSTDIQAEFFPALQRTQNLVVELNTAFEQQGTIATRSFAETEEAINRTGLAMQRLTELQSLLNKSATGNELRFSQPKAFDALQRSADTTQRAVQAPASLLADGEVAKRVQGINRLRDRIAVEAARIEKLKITPNVDASTIKAAQARLDLLADALNNQEAALSGVVDAERNAAAAAKARAEQEEKDTQRLIKSQQDAKRAYLDAEKEKDAASRRAAAAGDAEIAALIRREQAAKSTAVSIAKSEEDAAKRSAKAQDDEIKALIRREQAAKRATAAILEAEQGVQTARRDAANRAAGAYGGKGTQGIALGIDEKALRRIDGEFELLQNRLSAVSADIRGPAVASMQRYREASVRAFQDGTIATAAGRAELKRYRDEVIQVAAATLRVNPKGLTRDLQRVGDTSTRLGQRSSLAFQQLVFAIDDATSVTGGWDQRIRAAGNNLTQFGVIMGGTTGLIAALAATITAQGLASLYKWINQTDLAESRTKALNQALQDQQTAVRALADAYKQLSKEISLSGASDKARSRIEFSNRAAEIRRQSQEVTREDVALISPEVANIRGRRALLEKRLEDETDLGNRLKIQQQIDRSKRDEAAAAARGVVAPSRADLTNSLVAAENAIGRSIEIRLNRAEAAGPGRQQRLPGENADRLAEELFLQVETARSRLENGAGEGSRLQLAQLREVSDRLEKQRAEVVGLGESISTKALDDAIDEIAVTIKRLETALAPEVQALAETFNKASLRIAADLSDIASSSASVAIEREARRLAEELAAAQNAVATATSPEDVAFAQERQIAIEREVAQLSSVTLSLKAFGEALDRLARNLATTVLQEAQSGADQARREANQAEATGVDADFFKRRRRRLEAAAREAEDEAAAIRAESQAAQANFERQARAGQGPGAALIAERDNLLAIINGDVAASAEQVADANARLVEVNRLLAREFEQTAEGQAQRRRADEFDVKQQKQRERERLLDEGRDLLRNPIDAAVRQLRAIDAAAQDDVLGAGQRRGQARSEIFRGLAPGLFGLADQVANAVLQGPSRQALTATDVSSVEGAGELSRLLRGDDAARTQGDQVSLLREIKRVLEAIERAQPGGAP
jgi:hypothetical protein